MAGMSGVLILKTRLKLGSLRDSEIKLEFIPLEKSITKLKKSYRIKETRPVSPLYVVHQKLDGVITLQKFINIFLNIFQGALIIGVFVIEYLSTKKMGLMRYLVYQNQEFEKTIFSPTMFVLLKYKLFALIIIGIGILIYNQLALKKEALSKYVSNALLFIGLSIFIIYNLNPLTRKSFYFMILAFGMVIFIQVMYAIVAFFKKD
jgi:hypothetical protein